MASPQVENGFTRIANETMEALAGIRISGEARQCLDVIIRKTYGFHKKEDAIALSQFALITNIGKTNILRGLVKLAKMNLIVIKKDNRYGNIYRFNKNFDTWKPLPKKITVIKKDNLPLSKKRHTKETTTKEKNTPPKISFLILEAFKDIMGITTPDGDYQMDNLFPAKQLAKKIKVKYEEKEKGEITDDKILKGFKWILNGMDEFHKKNATSIKYINNNFIKIVNSIK